MKKLFSLVLVMVMLTGVFALVGCNGLWGFDDDDDVVGPASPNWKLTKKIELDSTAGLNLRAAAATSGYGKLIAKVFSVADHKEMTKDGGIQVADDGKVTLEFLGDANATYTVEITHPTKLDLFMACYFNKLENNKAEDVTKPVNATSTAIAVIASQSKSLGTNVEFTALENDPLVEQLAKDYTTFFAQAIAAPDNQAGTVAKPAAPVLVTGVTLDATSESLNKGDTFSLKATVAPPDATIATVTFSSSNTAVATVDKDTGLVTAVGGGVANITVTTNSGSKTAVCVVTVNVPVTGITLDKTTLVMDDGSTATLNATIAPVDATNKAVTWTSSRPDVATVDNGLVTSLKPGTTTITATAEGNTAQTVTCSVTVNAVALTGVTLNKTETSMVVGQKETLTASLVPPNATDKTVTWATSNSAVADVVPNTGEVTAKAVGTAVITVTTTDGGKTATCNITVVAAAVAVTGVTLSPDTAKVAVGAKTTLTATVEPTTATNKNLTWTSSNNSIASVDANGVVTGVAVGGPVTVTVKTVDGNFVKTCQVTVEAAPTTTTVSLGATASGESPSMAVTLTKEGLTADASLEYFSLTGTDGSKIVYKADTDLSKTGSVILYTDGKSMIADFDSIVFKTVLPTGTIVKVIGKSKFTVTVN